MTLTKSLKIGNKEIYPIFQGGMGVFVSRYLLAGTVAFYDCAGIISSAFLNRAYDGLSIRESVCEEVRLAREISKGNGAIGVNIMRALAQDFVPSILGAIDGGADFFALGAGLPLEVPEIIGNSNIALVPIISSGRALEIICKRWTRNKRKPDAVILEGPLAGGHLGFKFEGITKEENRLKNLFFEVKAVAEKYGNFPVIVAGGIYSHQDIAEWLSRYASGVQIGTRFLATEESSASPRYKQAVVDCTESDIVVADPVFNPPGSPCGMPFRVIKFSPMFCQSSSRRPLCNKGHVLQKDKDGQYTICPAKKDCATFFCICNGLLASADHEPNEPHLYTVGTNACRVDRIMSVRELIFELLGN